MSDGDPSDSLRRILNRIPDRVAMLRAAASLALPDAWLAAGAIRNGAWDALHGYDQPTPLSDADLIWFDPARVDPSEDRQLEATLTALMPNVNWSVKNQARMHIRHGHPPYSDCLDAMRAWPETATAIAARLRTDGLIELAAPYDLMDLMTLRLRPTPHCPPNVFRTRIESKGWLRLWPRLTIVQPAHLRAAP